MAIEVGYPFYPTSLEPRPMKAQQIWGVAEQVRRQLAPRRQVPRLDLERLTRLAGSMLVNGIAISTHWDFERSVHDAEGREALGVTEADPALPGIVLISLNAELISRQQMGARERRWNSRNISARSYSPGAGALATARWNAGGMMVMALPI